MTLKRKPKPFRQGQLDGFCGLYGIVNAMRYLGVIQTSTQGQVLMRQLCHVLESGASLEERLDEGTDSSEITKLLKEVVKTTGSVKRFKPFHKTASKITMRDYVQRLRHFLESKEGIVFIGLTGFHDHWSLISRATKTSFFFYDSDGLKRLSIKNCSLRENDLVRGMRIHIIDPYDTHFLWVD